MSTIITVATKSGEFRQLCNDEIHATALKCMLLMLLLLAINSPTMATALDNVQSVSHTARLSDDEPLRFETWHNARMEISLLRDNVFHVRAGLHDALTAAGDKSTSIIVKHDYADVAYTLSDQADYQLLKTAALALRIYKKPLRLALYKSDNRTLVWQELQPLELTDKSSFQTLSRSGNEQIFGGGQQNGSYAFNGKVLDISYSGGWEEGDRPSPAPFYMSSKGYGVLRNTWSNGQYDFRSAEFLTTTHQENRFDAYYFVGESIHEILAAYTELIGRAHLLPRWAYEFGDADCYNDADNIKKPGTVPNGWSDGPTGKTPDVIASVAEKYRYYDMPGGWILPNDGYGCGYSNLPEVVSGLKKYGFHTGLWTENGVDKIAWEVGTAGTRAQKLDVAWTGQGYQFALDANAAAAQGILDNSDARPFLWTVMGWAGMQRYAVTWTGDQSGSWDYIRWHIPTLIGSGLSGQIYATGDVDGIFGGSPETYTRDLQWKTFTPVLMGMSGWSKAERKHPWWFDEPFRSINRDYLKLKMRLMPYMYTYAWQAEQTGAPIVRGMMWDHPNDPSVLSGAHKDQFFLGQDFLVAPVYRSQRASHGWRKDIYLPEGQWIDYWDGRVVTAPEAGRRIDYQVTLDKLPVLVRAGAIIPMYPPSLYDGQVPKDHLTLDIYPYGHSTFSLYEDDGESRRYQQREFSLQDISVDSPRAQAGSIGVHVGAVKGRYNGMDAERVYLFNVHTRAKPDDVTWNAQVLKRHNSLDEFNTADSGWFYDENKLYGCLSIKTVKVVVGEAHELLIRINPATALAVTAEFPAAPDFGNAIAADSLTVLGRPAEESGFPLENAFDGKPETWFRTVRDQSQNYGAHEFTLALGERRLISGFEIAPRNDANWQYGQAKDVELYLADSNGEWGTPAYRGRLRHVNDKQTIGFPAKAGRLLRFRILSSFDENDDGLAQDPMVLAHNAGETGKAFNAFIPVNVSPISISEFNVLEYRYPDQPQIQVYLSDYLLAKGLGKAVRKDKPYRVSAAHDNHGMQMNGLQFHKGLGVRGQTEIHYQLSGDWQTFRADVGIDDSCRNDGGMHFQVWGDQHLLFDSGLVQAPAVVKPELDIRGLHSLTMRTLVGKQKSDAVVCANWANASLIGIQGARVQ